VERTLFRFWMFYLVFTVYIYPRQNNVEEIDLKDGPNLGNFIVKQFYNACKFIQIFGSIFAKNFAQNLNFGPGANPIIGTLCTYLGNILGNIMWLWLGSML
jgi:hypothetical protein